MLKSTAMPKIAPAAQLADRILRAAQTAASEEDLKIAVEREIDDAAAEMEETRRSLEELE
jgi:hypothetical protein